MSFLNSILSSIDGAAADTPPTVPKPGLIEQKADALPSVPAESRKRKAEDDLRSVDRKLSKPDVRGDGKPAGAASRPVAQASIAKSVPPKPATAAPTSRASTASPALAPLSKPPPKKGSFAEILARGQQNQQSMQISGISHKPIASVGGKKETLKQMKSATKQSHRPELKPATASSKPVPPRPGEGRKNGDVPLSKKGASTPHNGTTNSKAHTSYQGTAKSSKPASASAYQGTMRPGAKKSSGTTSAGSRKFAGRDDSTRKPRRDRYSDEDEDVGSDESGKQYDYVSDDYSDMDAGFDDVEDEERAAVRAAKREDALEQARLERLAQDKSARKKQALQALQAERDRVRRK